MKNLYIDIETYSSVNLKDCGVYVYSESPDAQLLLFGYSIDGDEVQVVNLTSDEEIPVNVLSALTDENITKWAHNAGFERIFMSRWLKRNKPEYIKSYGSKEDTTLDYLNPKGWKCSMVLSAYNGLPLSLENAGAVLKISEQKLTEGKDLVRFFCVPYKGVQHKLSDYPEKAERFIAYNKRDVEAEMGIIKRLEKYQVPDNVWVEYWISETINDRGILIDEQLVRNAIIIDNQVKEELMARMKNLTGLENPNSNVQLKGWLAGKGIEAESIDKKAVEELLKDAPPDVAEVLSLRQKTAKSSTKKYDKMLQTKCVDGRIRGMYMFYGASRTGRWAGRHVQMQNLRQNHLPDLDEARELVRNGDIDTLLLLYDDVADVLSQLIRTAFIPRQGYKFIVSDFSAVEARVLAFVANEKWRIKVFADGQDIYCASATAMFHVPVEKHGQNSELRQKGKIAELALGYGGSVGALKSMGALDMGLDESELQPLVSAWRGSNTNITKLWWDVDKAVKDTIRERTTHKTHGLTFTYQSGMLFMTLPSGRRLSYVKPRVEPNDFDGESITYYGTDSNKKFTKLESYGPKFVENAIQAISRDLIAEAMKRLTDKLCVGHIHDELILEVPEDTETNDICKAMQITPDWIEGLLLRADGYSCPYYQKDA